MKIKMINKNVAELFHFTVYNKTNFFPEFIELNSTKHLIKQNFANFGMLYHVMLS